MRRNDIIPIDSRSHLEVADRKHRYAKNLRVYFKEYHRLNGVTEILDQQTTNNGSSTPSRKLARYNPFFEWLDNQDCLPDLEECPRTVLDKDKVEYLTTDVERAPYEITISEGAAGGDGLWRQASTGELVNTGPKGWIFVLMFDRMYACEKRTSTFPRFHHSSFFAGAGVSAAGMVVCVNGRLTKLFPHSGHYRPHDRHLYLLLGYLREKGVALAGVQVDVQRVMKLSRQTEKDGAKARKTECALYMDGETTYSFLRSKNAFLEGGVLRQIIRRRGAAATAAAANADTAEEDASANLSVDSTAKEGPVESTALSIADGCVVVRPIPLNDTGTTAAEWNAEQEQDTEDGTGVSSRDVVADAKRQSGEFGASSHCDLNRSMVSTSSASSVGSPFCSPVARYQHYSFGASSSSKKKNSSSSKNAARAPSPAAAVVAESDFAAFGSGGESSSGKQGGVPSSSGSGGSGEEQPRLRQQQQQRQEAVIGVKSGVYSKSPGRDCNNGANQVPGSGGAVLQISSPTPSGGNSAAESRARVLGSLLYSTVNGSGKAAGVGCGRKASTELVPVSPPLVPSAASRSNSITAISSTGIAGSPSSSLPMKIPVPAPIKKVTSHTSISSSYGSTGYLASSYFYNRSRSASKADETGGVDYDIRLLLGDSPVVPVPLVQANVDANYGFYAFSDGNTACSPNAASTGNSNCNSRTRSRCSSFNPPYAAGASAASNISNSNSNFNNNLNTAITESSVLHRLASGTSLYYVGSGGGGGGVMDPSPTSSADSSPADKLKGAFAAAVVAASGSGSGKLGTYSAGQQVGGTSSSAAGSVASSRETATSAPLFDSPRGSIAARGSRNTARSRSSSLGNSYTFQQTNERISAAVSSTSVDKELFPTVVAVVDADCSREPEEGEGVSEGEGLGLFEGAPPPSSSSPVPSFASSLSSTDSMSNMLDLLLSPAGRAQERRRRERESRGERDGVGIGLQGLDGDRGGLLGDDDGAEDAEGLEGSYGYSFGAYGDGDGDWDGGVLADAGAQADLGLLPE